MEKEENRTRVLISECHRFPLEVARRTPRHSSRERTGPIMHSKVRTSRAPDAFELEPLCKQAKDQVLLQTVDLQPTTPARPMASLFFIKHAGDLAYDFNDGITYDSNSTRRICDLNHEIPYVNSNFIGLHLYREFQCLAQSADSCRPWVFARIWCNIFIRALVSRNGGRDKLHIVSPHQEGVF